MYELLIIAFLVVAIAIVVLVLIQRGKGADMGASFGAGASATLFGSAGTGNFLTRSTTILGILFFIISLALANISSKSTVASSTFSDIGEGSAAQSVIPNSEGNSQPVAPAQPANGSPTSDIPD